MTSLESLTGGRRLPVDFTAIERELAGLWKTASTAGESEASPAVMRACLLNLVVCCAGEEEAARATSTVAQVTRVRPARVLMAVVDGADREARLDAFISAHCSYTPGAGKGTQVCCEQITLAASGVMAQRLPGTVLPLLLPDLPVVLWWPGDPDLGNEISRRLIESADRIVVDARRFAAPADRFRILAALDRPVCDLAWHRLRGWRELVAGLFDGPVFEGYAQRIERVQVECDGRSAAEAALLAAWSAASLGWRHTGGPACERPSGERGELLLLPRPSGEGAGQVVRVSLEAPGAVFALRRSGAAECVTISVTLPDACPVPRAARVVARDEATLLCRSLEAGGRDPIYDEALGMAARLLEDLEAETGR